MKKLRIDKYKLLELTAPLFGFTASLVILLIVTLIVGENPGKVFVAIYKFILSTTPRLATVFSIAIPLFLAGLAVSFAFKAGIFNIGVEGQYFVGGLVGALAGIYLKLPAFLHLPVIVLASMLGGALWATIPALLKVRKGVHEVITTIMFNSIALALMNYLVNGPLSGVESGVNLEAQTRHIRDTALFGTFNHVFRAIGLNIPDYVYLDYSLIVAVIMGFLVWFLLYRFRYGFEIRAVGTAVDVAKYAGVKVGQVQIGAFLFSGALAGLIGLQEIFAIRGFYTFEIASGIGFDGIAIALIGRNSPLGVVFSSIVFAFLKQAGYGLQLYTSVPNSVIYVITGLMILVIVVSNEVVMRDIISRRKKEVV